MMRSTLLKSFGLKVKEQNGILCIYGQSILAAPAAMLGGLLAVVAVCFFSPSVDPGRLFVVLVIFELTLVPFLLSPLPRFALDSLHSQILFKNKDYLLSALDNIQINSIGGQNNVQIIGTLNGKKVCLVPAASTKHAGELKMVIERIENLRAHARKPVIPPLRGAQKIFDVIMRLLWVLCGLGCCVGVFAVGYELIAAVSSSNDISKMLFLVYFFIFMVGLLFLSIIFCMEVVAFRSNYAGIGGRALYLNWPRRSSLGAINVARFLGGLITIAAMLAIVVALLNIYVALGAPNNVSNPSPESLQAPGVMWVLGMIILFIGMSVKRGPSARTGQDR